MNEHHEVVITSKEQLKAIIKEEGDYWEGELNGFKCFVKRPSTSFIHLCGYIELGEQVKRSSIFFKIAKKTFHGGVTYNENGTIGFDCAHSGDVAEFEVNPSLFISAGYTYKTMEYVKDILEKTTKRMMEA